MIQNNKQKRLHLAACVLALFVSLGFTGWRVQSAFGARPEAARSPASAPSNTINSGGAHLLQNSDPSNFKDPSAENINLQKNAADTFAKVAFAGENPFERLARARRAADEAKAAATRSIQQNATTTIPNNQETASRPSEIANINNLLVVRALIDAGEKSTILVGDRVLSIGDQAPGTNAVFVRVETGKAYFKVGGEIISIQPSAKK